MDINLFKDNQIIICSSDYKKKILKLLNEHKLLLNIKFFSIREFIDKIDFSYDEKSIYYLINKYNLKPSNAKMYLDNLYYVESKDYDNKKLNYLVSLKNELIENNLLYFDLSFESFIKNKDIIYIGSSYLDKHIQNIFNRLNVRKIDIQNNYDIKDVYEFNDINEEVEYVSKSISKLLSENISINDIKLVFSSEYNIVIDRIFSIYNLPINLNKTSLYNLNITSDFLKYYNSDLNNTINKLNKYDSSLVNKIVSICNKYAFIEDKLLVKDLIINDLKNTYINNFNYENKIEKVSLDYPFDSEYVFVLGFNNGSIPSILYDEEYITDNIKEKVDLDTTVVINKLNKEITINNLKNIKNLYLSYKLSDGNRDYYPSSLIKELNLSVKKYDNNILDSFSKLNDEINYASSLDMYYKFGSINNDLEIYKNNLELDYKTYDNKFKGISKEDLYKHLNNKLTLSYSSLSNYSKCSYRYLISNILKLEKYEDKFEAYVGSVFHDVLEKCFNNDLDVHTEIEEYIKQSKRVLSIKERFFLKKIEKDISFVIDTIKKQNELNSFDKALYEQNFVINKDRDIEVSFTGFVDKLLYKDMGSKTLVTIIDYKTGNVDIDLKNIPYGLSMQLPTYLYLVKKSNIFENPKFVGFYLQFILDKGAIIDPKKSFIEQREDNLKLNGYSNSDVDYLEKFDSNYQNSNLIKSMKTKLDGNFSSYAKVLNDDQIDKIIDITEENIDKSIDNILNGKFDINPKRIDKKNYGCEFCKFKDLCFMKEENILDLDKIDDLSFLGGDNHA